MTRRMMAGGAAMIAIVAGAAAVVPHFAAARLLTPPRLPPTRPAPPGCVERAFSGGAGTLAGWQCQTGVQRRGTILYLHGIGDNRDSAAAVIERFLPIGYDVIAYDSRAHGRSAGSFCTYGFHEKHDVRRVIAETQATGVVLFGHSLGAAVALQAAAIEPAVRAVIAVSPFTDLRAVSTERDDVRRLPPGLVEWAITRIERRGEFVVADTSPLLAAPAIGAAVLLVHGADDPRPSPAHSERIFQVLPGPKQLIIVPGAAHHDALRAEVWTQIEQWLARQGTV